MPVPDPLMPEPGSIEAEAQDPGARTRVHQGWARTLTLALSSIKLGLGTLVPMLSPSRLGLRSQCPHSIKVGPESIEVKLEKPSLNGLELKYWGLELDRRGLEHRH